MARPLNRHLHFRVCVVDGHWSSGKRLLAAVSFRCKAVVGTEDRYDSVGSGQDRHLFKFIAVKPPLEFRFPEAVIRH